MRMMSTIKKGHREEKEKELCCSNFIIEISLFGMEKRFDLTLNRVFYSQFESLFLKTLNPTLLDRSFVPKQVLGAHSSERVPK